MDRWIDDISRVLDRSPTGALPLSLIAAELRREGVFLDPRDPWLRTVLREEKTRLRIIPVPRGPWAPRSLGEGGAVGEGDPGPATQSLEDQWVLLEAPPDGGFGPGEKMRARIREGFQAWAGELDGASSASVARWIHANLEGSRICTRLAGSLSR